MTKKGLYLFLVVFLVLAAQSLNAQCSICTKTASQLGEGPAKALNSAIIYLAFAPIAIIGFIGFRWWKKEQTIIAAEESRKP
ncbi:hypothetical protein [Sediminibacterium sp. TEGAF015]|uniref:hypothetical protein n=1 Tax=Sediminibacterium sp. TEGAF015 TaxID=575378 RepID=UPI002208052E|nr:hypothetical protein [Sediminibacterium sp. TEGAF015]BDQ12534.1 hypothetical protein TEGAF0_17510 [Sediminibacterium sp. TEGAF015]